MKFVDDDDDDDSKTSLTQGSSHWQKQGPFGFISLHRHSQGVTDGCWCTPMAEQNFGAQFTGESCKCTHQVEQESVFWGNFCWAGEIWMVGVVNLAVLACVLTATTKKGRKLFSRKKSAPQRKSWLRLCFSGKCVYSMWQILWMGQFTVNWQERKDWTFIIS